MKAITLLTPLFLNVTFGRFLFKAMQVLLFIVALFSALPPCWFSRMPCTITCFLSQVSNNNSEKIKQVFHLPYNCYTHDQTFLALGF